MTARRTTPDSGRVPIIRRLRIVGLGPIPLLVACAVEAPSERGAVVRDSAGITIVESLEPVWGDGEGWTLSPEPILDIGIVEGDDAYLLHEVEDAARTPEGDIIVANGGTQELRVYDASGRFVRSIGGQGEGPGEFQDLKAVVVRSQDSILAFDYFQRRATMFDSAGAAVRSISFASPGPTRSLPSILGDDSFILGSESLRQANSQVGADPAEFARSESRPIRYPLDGSPPDTIRVFRAIGWSSGTRA